VRDRCLAAPVPAPLQPYLGPPGWSQGDSDGAERLVFRRHSARARRIKAGRLWHSSPPPVPARCTRPARTMLPRQEAWPTTH